MRWGCENEYLVVVIDAAHESREEDEALEEVLVTVEIPDLQNDKIDPFSYECNTNHRVRARKPLIEMFFHRPGNGLLTLPVYK